jgi:hypothetical protein
MSTRVVSKLSIVLLLVGRPERSSSSIDTRLALKHECHSKTAVHLKVFSQILTMHFKGLGIGFTELHAKLYVDTLLDFAIHRRQNETRIRKSTRIETMRVHSAVSNGRLMQ